MLEITEVLLATSTVLAADGEEDGRALGLLFLLSGPLFYWIIYLRYRNSDKRHHHESETEASTADMRASDEYVKERKGLSSSSMSGANHDAVRGSIH